MASVFRSLRSFVNRDSVSRGVFEEIRITRGVLSLEVHDDLAKLKLSRKSEGQPRLKLSGARVMFDSERGEKQRTNGMMPTDGILRSKSHRHPLKLKSQQAAQPAVRASVPQPNPHHPLIQFLLQLRDRGRVFYTSNCDAYLHSFEIACLSPLNFPVLRAQHSCCHHNVGISSTELE